MIIKNEEKRRKGGERREHFPYLFYLSRVDLGVKSAINKDILLMHQVLSQGVVVYSLNALFGLSNV